MTDVLMIARDRQEDLRQEIAELDEFIRIAEKLLGTASGEADEPARSKPELRRERSEVAAARSASDDADDEAKEELKDSPDDHESVEVAEGDEADSENSEPDVRKFPWTGVQPAARRTGGDGSYPARRNVFRRDASAAG
jgi:hypothetical protein